LMSTVLH